MDQQIGRVDFLDSSQVTVSQPMAFTGLAGKAAKRFPFILAVESETGIQFLAQNIVPMPLIEPF
jgi:hypothetical protein